MRTRQVIEPAFLKLAASGELRRRAEAAYARLEACDLCAQECGTNRLAGETGRCHTGRKARVYGHHPHFGEEAPLVGWRGSGTIFFSWCNLRCQFCQNYEISQQGEGHDVTPEELAIMMVDLRDQGCHNINLVSPSHVVPMVLDALDLAAEHGLRLPIVYNTGGFDSLETLKLLDGVIDIYMPDMKCSDPDVGQRLMNAPNYPDVNRAAVREMHRQVGDLVLDAQGLARRGLIVRHLVLPEGLAGTGEIAAYVAKELSRGTYINVMGQYHPCNLAHLGKGLGRRVTHGELQKAIDQVQAAGLTRLDREPATPHF